MLKTSPLHYKLSLLALGGILLLVLFFWHLQQGATNLNFSNFLNALTSGQTTPESQIIRYIRLPRACMAAIAGSALGISGALLQTLTRNPLAAPATLGINAGAYFAVTVATIFFPDLFPPLAVALLGGIGAAALAYGIAGGTTSTPVRLILSGLAVSLALSAFTAALQLLFENETTGLFLWGAGSLSQLDWQSNFYAIPRVGIALFVAFSMARALDILALGDDVARSLGQNVPRTRLIGLLTAIFLAAVAVSVVGPIGFIGLVAPHCVRLLGIRNHALLLAGSAIGGAIVLLGADIVAQALTNNLSELPAGSITALIGAPVLIQLARHSVPAGESQPQSSSVNSFSSRNLPFSLLAASFSTALLLFFLLGLAWGHLSFPVSQVIDTLLGGGNALSQRVILQLRLPRLLVSLVAGASLAVSGLLLQGVVRNPLAGPEIVGITSGAGLGALTLLVIFPQSPIEAVPLAALIGAWLAFGLVYGLSWNKGISPTRFALMGVAMSAFCGAGIQILVVFSKLRVAQALVWLAGSTYARSWEDLGRLIWFPLVLIPLAFFLCRWLDLMALGEDLPRSLGVSLQRARGLVLAIAVALAAAAVSTVGTVSFVGLMAPHTARLLVGSHHRHLLPITALLGALIVLVADIVGRIILAPKEIPTGLVTALLGTPYFLGLLLPDKFWKLWPTAKSSQEC